MRVNTCLFVQVYGGASFAELAKRVKRQQLRLGLTQIELHAQLRAFNPTLSVGALSQLLSLQYKFPNTIRAHYDSLAKWSLRQDAAFLADVTAALAALHPAPAPAPAAEHVARALEQELRAWHGSGVDDHELAELAAFVALTLGLPQRARLEARLMAWMARLESVPRRAPVPARETLPPDSPPPPDPDPDPAQPPPLQKARRAVATPTPTPSALSRPSEPADDPSSDALSDPDPDPDPDPADPELPDLSLSTRAAGAGNGARLTPAHARRTGATRVGVGVEAKAGGEGEYPRVSHTPWHFGDLRGCAAPACVARLG